MSRKIVEREWKQEEAEAEAQSTNRTEKGGKETADLEATVLAFTGEQPPTLPEKRNAAAKNDVRD
jgi:hypothetical protein